MPIHEKKYYYKIIQDPASENPSGLAQDKGSNKVILSYSPGEWRLEEVPVAEIVNGDVYTLVPLSNFTFVLGTNFPHKNSSPSGAFACCTISWEGGTRGEAAFRVHGTMVSEWLFAGCDWYDVEPCPSPAVLITDTRVTEAYYATWLLPKFKLLRVLVLAV